LVTEWNPEAEKRLAGHDLKLVGRKVEDLIIPSSFRESHRKALLAEAASASTGELALLLFTRTVTSFLQKFRCHLF